MRILLPTAAAALSLFATLLHAAPATQPTSAPAEADLPVTFTGGDDTDPRDHGRPVILIANALNVTPDQFRQAFSGVHPAGPGTGGPTPSEARANKAALLRVLAPLGVTNERLDEVSNYYRYNRSAGQSWKHTPAQATAHIKDGHVTSITLTTPGAGYTTPPTLSIPGLPTPTTKITLSFTTNLATNGTIHSIDLTP